MYARVAETDSSDDITFIFDQIILRTNFPLIQTDLKKNPIGWKGIGVDPDDRSDAAIKKVRKMLSRMERDVDAIPIRYHDTTLGYLYYGDSKLIQELQWLPYAEVGIIGAFILIGFFGFANIKQNEQRHIWVGMAKETAHQLGTPISSLLGWFEVMKSGRSAKKEQIYKEMEKDLKRLQQVTLRFSQIGSKPDLRETDVTEALKEVVEYIRRRAPQIGQRVAITGSYKNGCKVPLNHDLFQWAIENIMRNALDAMDKEEGRIEVRLDVMNDGQHVFIEIEDNGKGIENSNKKRIFKPGYSTKKRGWGLGLTLAKRIIEEYHGGKLFVKETRPGEGTVVRIEL
jgi:signal transduction histidine kinase